MAGESKEVMRWFTVDISETYSHAYKVLAYSVEDAMEKAEEAVSTGEIDPVAGGSYDRRVEAWESSQPGEYDDVIERGEKE